MILSFETSGNEFFYYLKKLSFWHNMLYAADSIVNSLLVIYIYELMDTQISFQTSILNFTIVHVSLVTEKLQYF